MISGVWNNSYIDIYDLRCMEDLILIDTWYQMNGKACS